MIKNKEITSRDENFADWYTNIVQKAGIVDYSSVKGFSIFAPNGYAIWENIQKVLDKKFKETGHKNVYMPLLIPESLLNKEAEHIEGFAPEVAWVTQSGANKLEEKLCIRPTSETIFCDYYSKIVKSYRDLPKLYNQWCSVVRWEKETRPLLRNREFMWQEGHTVHASQEEAEKETLKMLNIYKDVFENYLAIPVVVGKKTEKEKFAGAEYTYTIEALMHSGIALQSATSHYFGQKFSKPFDIKFLDKDNTLKNVYQTSWGFTTRSIGAIIMVHGDDNGLVLPPRIAPTKVAIIPCGKDEKVAEKCKKILKTLEENDISSLCDQTERSPGFKFAQYEMEGVPVRIELGSRDLEANQITVVRRDCNEKITMSLDCDIAKNIAELLEQIQKDMFERAKKNMEERTYEAKTIEDIEKIINTKPGFIKAMWCGDQKCEEEVKKIGGTKSRCMPFDQTPISDKCVVCGKPAKYLVIWGIQY